MIPRAPGAALEEQIAHWRNYRRRRQAPQPEEGAKLEVQLRQSIEGLRAGGLSAEEAFLVAVKRLGGVDALSREFAREHSERPACPNCLVCASCLCVMCCALMRVFKLHGVRAWGQGEVIYSLYMDIMSTNITITGKIFPKIRISDDISTSESIVSSDKTSDLTTTMEGWLGKQSEGGSLIPKSMNIIKFVNN
jgi:hypothetical protein